MHVESSVAQKFLNLACGDFYLSDPEWVNLDWYPHSKRVQKANLLEPLPFQDNQFDVVYTSHFVEHIPRSKVSEFLSECHRVLKPNGIIRIVVPDFENIAREYLFNIEAGNNLHAEFNIIELIDQCVRTNSGGLLSSWRARSDIGIETRKYVSLRTGYKYKSTSSQGLSRASRMNALELVRKVKSKFSKVYILIVLKMLPKWFQDNHINLTNTGELHRWVYDFNTIQIILQNQRFSTVEKFSSQTSSIHEFPFFPLDIDESNDSRKGLESMYIEARK